MVAVARGVAQQGGDVSYGSAVSVGASVRFGVARRGPVQLLGVGNVGVSRASSSFGASMATMTSATLSWGIAIDYWLQRHLALSVSAINPLVSHSGARDRSGGMEQAYSSTSYGLTIAPTIGMMLHLFY
jgi:hypothetical protein